MTVSKMEMDGSMPPAVPALMMASTRAAVNEDLGSDGRIDLADTTVQSGGRNAGDPSLVDREHGLPADGAPGPEEAGTAQSLVISGAQDSDFGEHVPSLLFAEQLRLWGIVTRNVWERNQRLHRIMLYGII